ncbi:MAG: carbonic anhydrase family protein [Pseudomonadota bacterium]|nr:carbonic anhydrase family protein [Pseudomonadota bacterium]
MVDFTPSTSAPITFDYRSSDVELEHVAHTLRANIRTAGNTIKFNGKVYQLEQFHFHHRSEHLVAGKSFPLELHLVHADDKGSIAVVGIFFQVREHANQALIPVWSKIPVLAGKHVLTDQVDLRLLRPANSSAWHYRGSLTTPPCSEGVEWIIMTTMMGISAAQLQLFTDHYQHNYRPVQTLGNRTVYRIC